MNEHVSYGQRRGRVGRLQVLGPAPGQQARSDGVVDRGRRDVQAEHREVGAAQPVGVELRVGLDQLVGWERGPFGVGAAGADLAQIDLAAQQCGIDPVGAADVEDRPGAPLPHRRGEHGLEDGQRLLWDLVLQVVQGAEVRPRIRLVVDPGEVRLAITGQRPVIEHRYPFEPLSFDHPLSSAVSRSSSSRTASGSFPANTDICSLTARGVLR